MQITALSRSPQTRSTRPCRLEQGDPVDCFVPSPRDTRADLAKKILADDKIVLHNDLPSGNPPEGSDPLSNIQDTAAGKKATRSHYGSAPGGQVFLDKRMLAGMLSLEQKGWTLEISAVCGGEHSHGSLHYSGTAFDILKINGVDVDKDDGVHAKVMADLRKLGATEVLGPGHVGHDHHVHGAWPRRTWVGPRRSN